MIDKTTLHFSTKKLMLAHQFMRTLERETGVLGPRSIMGSDIFRIDVVVQAADVALARSLAEQIGISEGYGARSDVQRVQADEEGGEVVGKGSKGAKAKQVRETKQSNAKPPAPSPAPTNGSAPAGDKKQAYKAYPRCPAKGCGRYMKDMERHWQKEPSHRPSDAAPATEQPKPN